MVFKRKKEKIITLKSITVIGQEIDKVKYTKFLRLNVVDEHSWKGIIARARHYVSIKTLLTIYNCLAVSHLLDLTWWTNLAWLTTLEEATRLSSLVLTRTFSKTQLAIQVQFYGMPLGMLFLHILRASNLRFVTVIRRRTNTLRNLNLVPSQFSRFPDNTMILIAISHLFIVFIYLIHTLSLSQFLTEYYS